VPGPEHNSLINPYGPMFNEIIASDLVKVGLDGQKADDSPFDINPAESTIHRAGHAARDDDECVLEVRSVYSFAVSALEDGVCFCRNIPSLSCRPLPTTTVKAWSGRRRKAALGARSR
jgi:ribulose-5-phosphate 4-epimerase/fuculose-1-phosphate aldolase